MNPMKRLAATIDKLNSAAARDNAAASDAGCNFSLHPASHPLHGQPEHGAPWSAHWQADEIKKASK